MIYRKLSTDTYSAYCFHEDGPWPQGMTRRPEKDAPILLQTPSGPIEVHDLDMVVNGPNGTGDYRAYSIQEFNREFVYAGNEEPDA